MPILARLALAISVLTIPTVVAAKPREAPTLAHEAAAAEDPISMIEEDDEEEEVDEEEEAPTSRREREEDADEAPVKLTRKLPRRLRDWHLSFGPNVWLSSVQADVAVGDKTVTAAVDFMAISHYTKFAAPLLAEARYKRFSFVGDLTYAVVGLTGGNEVGPLDIALTGNVSSLQFDGLAGYRVYGDEDAKFSAEARAGVRYARMAISGDVMLSGSEFAPKQIVSGSSDLLVGGRVFVKPWKRVFATAAFDQSVAGTSDSTWSLAGEANVRISNHVLLNAGYKTMVQRSGSVTQTMFGPKFSLQVLF